MQHTISWWNNITKTCLYNSDPLEPHFYIVRLGFTGVYISFLISAQNIDCGYSLEPPRRGGSNEYPQSMFWAEIWKRYQIFSLKIYIFWWQKFSVHLNRRVFVMRKKSLNICFLEQSEECPRDLTNEFEFAMVVRVIEIRLYLLV